jgi:pSer/pThr/pTyr-binding forkhead associated (FHA) protein
MARLILSLQGQSLAEYNMGKERYTIGRLSDNDVRIDNPAVSGHHALIINILNDSFLEDLNSTNVNGKLIKKHALQHGDVVTVGHHQLRFIDSQVEGEGNEEFARTLVIQPTDRTDDRLPALNPRAIPANPANPPATPAPARAEDLAHARLQVLSGPLAGRELELTKVVTTLGRPGVQIAAITRRADSYYLVQVEDSAGNTPLQVNNQPIGAQAHRLQDNDVITLAGVKMGFFAS